jgi:hypothetical protein
MIRLLSVPARSTCAGGAWRIEMQMKRSLFLCSWGLLFLAVAFLPGTALAHVRGTAPGDDPNQAALVVQFSDERVETRCIDFEGEEITGGEMLARSGLDAIMDVSSGLGVTVCQIEGQGCVYPAEHCFCQCMGGGECAYWNYFYRDPGSDAWVYSPLGAGAHKARPGSVEAWVWGDGRTPPAKDLTFTTICAAPTAPAPILTATPQATAAASPTPIVPEATPRPAPTHLPRPAVTATPTQAIPTPTWTTVPSSPGDAAPDPLSYWPFGLMVLILALVGAIAWLRR